MKTPLRVVWSEGLLMSPQHMQQLDLYHENLIGSRLAAVHPNPWGVVAVKVDPHALETGQVRLNELRAVLADGLVINCGQGDPELPPSRPIEAHFPANQVLLEVFIGVPRERDGLANYASAPGGRSRFVIHSKTVPDLTGEGNSLDVAFANRNLSILFGDEARDDYESLKIAEFTRDASGAIVPHEPYCPPALKVAAAPYVLSGTRRLLKMMAARRRTLAAQNREMGDGNVEFNAADITRFLLLNCINSYLPIFAHVLDFPELPPRQAFLWMSAFAGELATFSADFDPGTLPKFNHSDLRSTFEPLLKSIEDLLQAMLKEQFVALLLDAREDGMHLGQLVDDRLIGCEKYVMAVRTSTPEQETAQMLPQLSKIASWSDINGILSVAVSGAALQVTYHPPQEIPKKAGTLYFEVDTSSNYWRNIVNDRQIAVYLPRNFDPSQTRLELLGIPRKG
jgi:type VI secretion system protein ImpJ